jgi:hypothetical protein
MSGEDIHAHAFQALPTSWCAGRAMGGSCPDLARRQYQDRRAVAARRVDRHDRALDPTAHAAAARQDRHYREPVGRGRNGTAAVAKSSPDGGTWAR